MAGLLTLSSLPKGVSTFEMTPLELTTRIYRDRDHYTVVPLILGDGLQAVFADEAKLLPPPAW